MTFIFFCIILLIKRLNMNNPFILKLIRMYFRFTSVFFPILAIKSAHCLFHTPIQTKQRDTEKKLAKKSEKWNIKVDSHTTLQVYRWGKKEDPLVLIVHGWSSRATGMSPYIIMLLKNSFQVISYDAINHGNSKGKISDLANWAKSVNAVLKSVNQVECIIAHSLGAGAVTMASNIGLNTKKLILISPMNDVKAITDKFGNHFGISLDIVQKMREFNWKINEKQLSIYGKDWEDLFISSFYVPTLIIHDKDDDEVNIKESKTLIKTWSWATLIVTEGLGHKKILYSKKVMGDILDFIRE